MTERVSQQIWCERCADRHFEYIVEQTDRNRMTVRGGPLREATRCDLCWATEPARAYALAVTFYEDELLYEPWEELYLDVPPVSPIPGQ